LQVLLLAAFLHLPPSSIPALFDCGLLDADPIRRGVAQQVDGSRLLRCSLSLGGGGGGGGSAVLIGVDDVAHEAIMRAHGELHLSHLSTHCFHLLLHVGLGGEDESIHLLLHLAYYTVLYGHFLPLYLHLQGFEVFL
jgi:hypothetical protein